MELHSLIGYASHGYQIVLIRSVEAAFDAFDAFEDLRPDAVFLGLVKADPPATISLQTLRRMTNTVYPPIP